MTPSRLQMSYLFLLLLSTCFITSNAAGWWAVGVSGCSVRNPNVTCPNCAQFKQDKVFSDHQEKACRKDPATIPAIARGIRKAIIDCQTRFNESRWNCSTFYGEHLFGAFIDQNYTRERGVVNAYVTAGAIYGIADFCHNQQIPRCPCIIDTNRRVDKDGNIIFESCKADYDFAVDYVSNFVTNQIDDSTKGGIIDQHNINIGEQASNRYIVECHCHGISGTCSVQTCYKRVPCPAEIGHILYNGYNGAVEVKCNGSGEVIPAIPSRPPPTSEDIIYSDNSPNFCVENSEVGTVGVADRVCSDSPNSINNCDVLCCNNGNYRVTRTVSVRKCDFIWCCRIECSNTEQRTITEKRCNPPPPSGVGGESGPTSI